MFTAFNTSQTYFVSFLQAASSLACARRGWVNVDVDKIQCESCGANLKYNAPDSHAHTEGENGEEFANQLDEGHNVTCPWRGNSCAESLVQFPPTPPSALIGGYKDRCDGLLQFPYLPVVAASAIEQMKLSRGPEIDRLLVQSAGFFVDVASDLEISVYSRAQKLISLCGWEPRWLSNIQDCEEHSAQSARNGASFSPIKDDRNRNKKLMSASTKKIPRAPSKFESRSPLLDCSLCGATVRILDFIRVNRPARFAPNNIDVPETSKKMALTRGVSAASGISGWVADGGGEKEQTEDVDEAATTGDGKSMSNIRVDLNLTMGSGFPTGHGNKRPISELYQEVNIGRDLVIGQPAGSEVGDRAQSFESRGPTTFKRNMDEGGSTVDRPQGTIRQADSVEGVVIDRDGDEVNDSKMSPGPSKRARESHAFEHFEPSSGAGPSQTLYFDIGRAGPSSQGNELTGRASSVIAMDTVCHSDDNDSMESVENHPGFIDEVNYPSGSGVKSPDVNDNSDLNVSIQAQQSVCPPAVHVTGEIGVSSTNDDEVLNTDTTTIHGRDGPSFAISGGSVGMGVSHEAEIHGSDALIHRTESVVGDMEPVTGVTENQGQTGEFVPEEVQQECSGRADSGSKIVGSVKAESVESGDKTSDLNLLPHEHSDHPSLSCNAVVFSGIEASKDEVTQGGKSSPNDECGYPSYPPVNGIGPPNGESNFEEAVEFDPIKHHNFFCPWVNGNVAAAGVSNNTNGATASSSSSVSGLALCGWQLTLDALDGFQGPEQNQSVESESAASLYKDEHQVSGRKLMARHSFNRSHGHS
ncbi:zinc finger, C3HC [Artemisia annua]|uniref:Zinc finger, C3HC n=1 Tax=Artemisia annua TaxID=35608 RepID=A0A2U1NV94_ARTAN|nr:zinc finger, C3HC [Artemisia annua]